MTYVGGPCADHGTPGAAFSGWKWPLPLLLLALALVCSSADAGISSNGKVVVDDKSFGCIALLTSVRGFFVGNLLGNLQGTLAIAQSRTGGIYPPGSLVQLVPTEVMVKQPQGFNPTTHDWEFFSLAVSKDGSKVLTRGFADTVNSFGGNCFGCHIKARPQWDMICEANHGCDPLPITSRMIGAIQRTDPRCKGSQNVSVDDAAALKELDALRRAQSGGG
jgi:hypothetical protein